MSHPPPSSTRLARTRLGCLTVTARFESYTLLGNPVLSALPAPSRAREGETGQRPGDSQAAQKPTDTRAETRAQERTGRPNTHTRAAEGLHAAGRKGRSMNGEATAQAPPGRGTHLRQQTSSSTSSLTSEPQGDVTHLLGGCTRPLADPLGTETAQLRAPGPGQAGPEVRTGCLWRV